jgi:hypothetical protein
LAACSLCFFGCLFLTQAVGNIPKDVVGLPRAMQSKGFQTCLHKLKEDVIYIFFFVEGRRNVVKKGFHQPQFSESLRCDSSEERPSYIHMAIHIFSTLQ